MEGVVRLVVYGNTPVTILKKKDRQKPRSIITVNSYTYRFTWKRCVDVYIDDYGGNFTRMMYRGRPYGLFSVDCELNGDGTNVDLCENEKMVEEAWEHTCKCIAKAKECGLPPRWK